jgi:hypothetical protein
MTTPEDPRGVRRARLKLALMFVMPAAVVLLATLVYLTGIGIPGATTNKGVLVEPPRQIDVLALRDAGGVPWRYEGASRGWGILVSGTEACDAACRERIDLTRRVRLALGKDTDRLHRYYLAAGAAPEPDFAAWLAAEHKDLRVLLAEPRALRELLGRPGDPDPLGSGAVYLVDPRGFVMMHYLPAHPGRATLDDLRFLLRNSPD